MIRRACALALVLAVQLAGAAHVPLPPPGSPDAPNDQRYCGEPTRDKYGVITRSAVQLRKFVAVFPCPATLLHVTSCQGWQIDHVIPRASGGCDIPLNMQWLPATIKTCADDACKDRWERTYHAIPRRPVQL
jgi:hypothetical protein